MKTRMLAGAALLAVAVTCLLGGTTASVAALGDVLKDNDPGGPQGDGRGLAFDGINLYSTLAGDPNIYKMTTAGGPGSAVATLPVPLGDPRVAVGGPLAWDGTNLWIADDASLVVYQVDPVSGATLFSCDIAAANPGHPALASLNNPDGLDYANGELIVSGYMSRPGSVESNAIAFVDPATCVINSWFAAPAGLGVAGFGTTGVASDGTNLWHATPGGAGSSTHFFQTDAAGTTTGATFNYGRQHHDLAYDTVTFAPLCALWAHEGSFAVPPGALPPPIIKKEHITAFEIPCAPGENLPPRCDAGGRYSAECSEGGGTLSLDGTGSSDPEGHPLTYAWTTDCAGGSIVDPSGSLTTLTASGPPPCPVNCTVELTVTDDAGQSATCTAPVTIADTTPPIVGGPGDLALECNEQGGVSATDPNVLAWLALASANDSCGNASLGNDAPAFFPSACDGATTPVTFTGTDDCLNSATAIGNLTVSDTTGPALSVPAPLVIECPGPGGIPSSDPQIMAWLDSATATDICGTASVTNDAPAFFEVTCGSTTPVTFTATDNCGRMTSLSSTITITDSQGPVITVPMHKMIACRDPFGIPATDPQIQGWLDSATATDVCSGVVPVSNDAPAIFPINCEPKTGTTVNWSAQDSCGNPATASSIMQVVDFVEPVLIEPPVLNLTCPILDPPESDPRIAAWLATAVSYDECSTSVSLSWVLPADIQGGQCPLGKKLTVQFTSVDTCGNIETQKSHIKISRKQPSDKKK
jgi:hypothetical protein